jgi:transposase
VLERGAYAYGYAEDYWTLDRVAHLISDLFQIRYRSSSVWYLLHRLGWSCQKPQRRALHRNEQAIAHWKHYRWPQIKRKWRALGATLIFLDESGFSMVSPLKRTWSPRGQTPSIRTSIEHKERINLIGALCVSPKQRKIKLHLQSYRPALRGEQVILFLKRLLRCIKGPIVMVWDRHPIHRRGKVQNFLACHPRLYVYEFPIAAPELNPTEFVWTQISEYIANTAPRNYTELRANVLAGSTRIRRSQQRLWNCIFASDLPWER